MELGAYDYIEKPVQIDAATIICSGRPTGIASISESLREGGTLFLDEIGELPEHLQV